MIYRNRYATSPVGPLSCYTLSFLVSILNNLNMSGASAARAAGKVGQAIGNVATKANTAANQAASGSGKQSTLNKGAKRDPELYVRFPLRQIATQGSMLKIIPDPTYHYDGRLWHGWVPLWTQTHFLFLRSPCWHGSQYNALANDCEG